MNEKNWTPLNEYYAGKEIIVKKYGYNITRFKLSNELHGLSDGELRLYIALRTFADSKGYCYPSYRFLARVCGCCKETIQKRIHSLKDSGHILTIEIKRGSGGKRHAYWLNLFKKSV
jgi:biotin operon repressor